MKTKLLKIILPVIAVILLLAGCHPKQQIQTVEFPTQAVTVKPETVDLADAKTVIAETETQNSVNYPEEVSEPDSGTIEIKEDGYYSSKDEVAAYIHRFGKLPGNYITKSKARKLGWGQNSDSLGEVLPGMSIGGGRFGNNEGLLPEAQGREYYECDIDFDGEKRNAKRIVYSNDGLIFYTEDHYESFEQLY
ncbi:MAG: ribonuclease domain-containing protein [Lachnospiraceae bacterium]|nr:ribonuclease domain-containing protein [Lachnospiraceae bacterium]